MLILKEKREFVILSSFFECIPTSSFIEGVDRY